MLRRSNSFEDSASPITSSGNAQIVM